MLREVPEKPAEYSEVWQENHCLPGTPAFQFYITKSREELLGFIPDQAFYKSGLEQGFTTGS